jgi:putative DNA primase/helicase
VQPDPEIKRFIHRIIGYSATGDTSEQKLFFFLGDGRNGKSTFVEAWAHIFGDYAATIPIETFLKSGQNQHGGQATPHLARLRGVRMLRTSEPEKGAILAEALIKLLTSGEPIPVRRLNQEFFDLKPKFKLIISGNYRPHIRGTDEGIWRRVAFVPWPVKITDQQCVPHLAEKLAAEAPGILNRILEGLCDWLDNGLAIPNVIKEATTAYRSDADHLGRFMTDCVVRAPGKRVSSTQCFNLYTAWAKATGAPHWSQGGDSLRPALARAGADGSGLRRCILRHRQRSYRLLSAHRVAAGVE